MHERPLTICDVSPFYCETGGGIRTYHHARIEWFRRQRRHRYLLIRPGPRFRITPLGSHVTVAHVYGLPLRGDADGYRAMLDFAGVRRLVRQYGPQVVEMGDVLVGGILRLALRHRDGFEGVIASFCHSDPVATYVDPRLRRVAQRIFSHVQSRYDVTIVASRAMQDRLEALGVANVVRAPFGVDPLFLRIVRCPPDRSRPAALLYVGRLDADKEIGLLIDIVPRLLMRRDVTLTVVGAGRDEAFFRRLSHPRFTYRGFIRDRSELARVYSASDVLLAPGRYETFGLAALEAAAAGLAVVGPNAGGTGELLAQMDSPLLFDAGDAAAFCRAIDRAVGSDLGCLAARSRALAASYGTWDDAVARHVALYESMVERR